MIPKKISDLTKQFESLTLKDQIHVLARNAFHSHLHLAEIVDEVEKTYLQLVLQENDFNLARAALFLNLHRNTIRQKIKKFNLKREK